MAMLKLWIVFVYLATSTVATVNPVNGSQRDIVDTIVGEQSIIGTWSLNGSNLAINVTKDKGTRLAGIIDGSIGKHTTVQFGRLLLKYNHSIMAASLMFVKVSREDEGLYEIEESVYTTKTVPYDSYTYASKTEYGRWILELNVLDTGEVIHGETGKSITMEFDIVLGISILSNYVMVSDLMGENGCSMSTQSHLYGRLKCTRDTFLNLYWITIDNVTQRDAGLYKVSTGRDTCVHRFINITEKHTCAVVGDDTTIGWLYNQQGIQRTLLVIHNNLEVIMQLAPTNVPEIKSKFKHRLSYKGDVSRSFMVLSLLNVRMSDAGIYSPETIHGNKIPGSKQLNVKGGPLTAKKELMPDLTNGKSTDSSTTRGPSLIPSVEILDTEEYITSPSLSVQLTSPDKLSITREIIYVVIPVTIITLAMVVGCMIWIRHNRLSTLETVRPHPLEECDLELYITPIHGESHLPIPLVNDGHTSDSQTAQSDSRVLILHTNQSMCMDGYEIVDDSNYDAAERVCNSDEIVYELTENMFKPVHNNCGYLTVLGALENSV